MKLKILMIMILLLLCSEMNYSQIKSIDNNYIAIPKDTFKIVIGKLIERNSFKEQLELVKVDNELLLQKNQELNLKVDLYKNNKDELLKYIEESKPAWYDNFYFGFGSAAIITIVLMVINK